MHSGDDNNAQSASSKKKRKTPSSLRRSSSNAQVKRRVSAAVDDDDDGEAAQRRDEARARVRERLTEVLLPAISEAVVAAMNAMLAGAMVGGAVSDSDVRQVAAAVEACLFEQCGKVADSNYVGKARSLLFNLKTTENAPLRVSLVRGQITPLQLCNMSAKVRNFILHVHSQPIVLAHRSLPRHRTWLPLALRNRSRNSSSNQCRST